jgi:tetratricopeptide (TPR) repeat protein
VLRRLILALVFALAGPLCAQEGPQPQTDSKVTIPKKKTAPPRSDQQQKDKQESDSSQNDQGFSSSKDYVIDLRPPAGSRRAEVEEPSDINELKPWDPHKSAKSIEVGDYYFKRKRYGAAESRYREALEYKPNDAIASFRLGQVLERTKRGSEAIEYYQAYLKILPEGEFSEECRKAIARLSGNAKR